MDYMMLPVVLELFAIFLALARIASIMEQKL